MSSEARTITGETQLGRICRNSTRAGPRAGGDGRLDERLGREPGHLRLDEPAVDRPAHEADGQHGVRQAAAEHGGDRERQDQLGDRDHDVGEAHDHLAHAAARRSRRWRRARCRCVTPMTSTMTPTDQRDAGADEHPAEHVAAQLVGAERVRPARRLQAHVGVDGALGVLGVRRERRARRRAATRSSGDHDQRTLRQRASRVSRRRVRAAPPPVPGDGNDRWPPRRPPLIGGSAGRTRRRARRRRGSRARP